MHSISQSITCLFTLCKSYPIRYLLHQRFKFWLRPLTSNSEVSNQKIDGLNEEVIYTKLDFTLKAIHLQRPSNFSTICCYYSRMSVLYKTLRQCKTPEDLWPSSLYIKCWCCLTNTIQDTTAQGVVCGKNGKWELFCLFHSLSFQFFLNGPAGCESCWSDQISDMTNILTKFIILNPVNNKEATFDKY